MKSIKYRFVNSKIFNFNLVERDIWVAKQASLVPENSSVIDIGAGSCPYRHYFSHCEYKTQDFTCLTPEQLRGKTGYDKIDYICDATNIPVTDASFDVILCTEVLEHVPEPIKVIYEFSRILNPEGKLLLTAPLGSGIHQEPYHFYGGYTPYWYQKFLTEAGFSAISIEPNGGFFKHYGQESIRFVQMTIPWKLNINFLVCVMWALIWLIILPFFVFVVPIVCHFLDIIDQDKKFTIGYHVIAIKKGT
ncbi:class I SAM-dependent methyltransferase [Anabaena sp. UHCC 0399]|uniref:class I SAM-dependent methyltransferase n=1 Tax=Anabaena sp. UHCC 0399 TaxID=3110238 RepID=UPI002B20E197|nr:class I SAM-dependent methyltransferase [Anabaena sp. UHCC 0399]MEA5566420.1 class I SAM-dependent methyltransferase [Anabaena sp. UHCC 0399]